MAVSGGNGVEVAPPLTAPAPGPRDRHRVFEHMFEHLDCTPVRVRASTVSGHPEEPQVSATGVPTSTNAWQPERVHEDADLPAPEDPDDVVEAAGATFLGCRLTSAVLVDAGLTRTTWRGGTLTGVRFVGGRMARSSWHEVTLDDCALAGCELYGTVLRGVTLRGCVLDAVNLRGATLQDVAFENCVLRDLDLGSATLTGLRFPACRVERLDLTNATLTEVDLRGAELDMARGLDRLAGAVVDAGQLMTLAPAMAAHLGLEVR